MQSIFEGTMLRQSSYLLTFLIMLCSCSGGAASTSTPAPISAKPNAVTGQTLATMVPEIPASSNSFIDSVGVAVDFQNITSSTLQPLATAVGNAHLRHIRLNIFANDPTYDAMVSEFFQISGTKGLGITNCVSPLGQYSDANITAQNVRDFQTAVDGNLEAYEAMNEPDLRSSADPNWVADLKSCIAVQTGVNLPFLAPALGNELSGAQPLGNVGQYFQGANIHRYFSGNSPDSSGWGGSFPCGIYGSLSWAKCEAAITAPNLPDYVTETGYNSDTDVDLATQAKYTIRALLVNFRAGITRTYLYCLLGYVGADGGGGYGLFDPSAHAKPSFSALSTAMELFADAGITKPTAAVSYSISGPASLEHVLFQRSDGSYILALWNETQSWNPNGGGEIFVAPQRTTISFGYPVILPSATTINDVGTGVATSVANYGESISLPIDDHVTFVKFLL